jgi:hypothetical protein
LWFRSPLQRYGLILLNCPPSDNITCFVCTVGAYDDLSPRIGGLGFIGAYTPEQRRARIDKFIEKRGRRVWTKKVKYDVRKNFADSRLRVKVSSGAYF